MTSVNVSVPDSMKLWIDKMVVSGRFPSASKLVRTLIRDAQVDDEDLELESELLVGLASPSREMTAAEWANLKNLAPGTGRRSRRKGKHAA